MPGFAEFIQSIRPGPDEGVDPFERARQAPDRPDPDPPDADEYAANLLTRRYVPGMVTDLAQRLADVMAELASVQEANEAARRRQERIARDHAAGKITAFDIARMDFDEPDRARAEQLRRRAASLRGQLADAQAMIAPPQAREPDPLEAASRRAHQAFVEATQAKLADAQGQAPRQSAARPFGGRGGLAGRNEPVTCDVCLSMGATPEESFLIHHMDADGNPLATSPDAPVSVPPDDSERSAAGYGREVTRACGYDEGGVLGNQAQPVMSR